MVKSDFCAISRQKNAGCQKRDVCTRDAFLSSWGSPVRLILRRPSPSPRVCTDGRTDVRSYADVITKFTWLDGLPNILRNGAPLRAPSAHGSSATKYKRGTPRSEASRKGLENNGDETISQSVQSLQQLLEVST